MCFSNSVSPGFLTPSAGHVPRPVGPPLRPPGGILPTPGMVSSVLPPAVPTSQSTVKTMTPPDLSAKVSPVPVSRVGSQHQECHGCSVVSVHLCRFYWLFNLMSQNWYTDICCCFIVFHSVLPQIFLSRYKHQLLLYIQHSFATRFQHMVVVATTQCVKFIIKHHTGKGLGLWEHKH